MFEYVEIGNIVVIPELASWYISGGGWSVDVELPVPFLSAGSDKGLSFGGGGMQFDVKSKKQPDNVFYRMTFLYAELEISAGFSAFGVVSVAGASPDMPVVGTRVMRNIGAPGDGGADGPPTGFLGTAYTLSLNAGSGPVFTGGALVMGARHERWAFALGPLKPLTFKYAAFFGSAAMGSSLAVGGAVQLGSIVQIDKYVDGQPTHETVVASGLACGDPYRMNLNPFQT